MNLYEHEGRHGETKVTDLDKVTHVDQGKRWEPSFRPIVNIFSFLPWIEEMQRVPADYTLVKLEGGSTERINDPVEDVLAAMED